MKRKKKKRRYMLHSEYLGFTKPIGVIWFLALVVAHIWVIKDIYLHYQEYHDIWSESFSLGIGGLQFFVMFFILHYYTTIKKLILYRFGVKHKAEIVQAKYYRAYRSPDRYYLEIAFINNKGREKRLHTQGYHDSPNVHLKSVYCSVYEWKGFCVEGDFQLFEDDEVFERRTPPIPTDFTNVNRSDIGVAGCILCWILLYLLILFILFIILYS